MSLLANALEFTLSHLDEDADVVKWCPRCRFIREQTSDAGYCLRCGTAMLDRFCVVCSEPLFGPDLMHLTTMLKGGPHVI